jgi:hypothetical protein
MTLLGHIRLLSVVSILLVFVTCISFLHPALANIYVYTAGDGSVNLSNVPADSRYALLVGAQNGPPFAATAGDRGGLPPGIAGKAFYDVAVDEVARTYGVESALLHAVISVESRYSPRAVSKKGAAGLMQLMPVVTKHYGVADPLDPMQNLHGGAKYLRDLLKRYNNDTNLALAAYNAGQSAVTKYGNRIPPYRETMNYVPRVLGFYRRYQADSQQINNPEEDLASRF